MSILRISSYEVFPIRKDTFVGIATALDVTEYNLVHFQADSNIVFTFEDASIKSIDFTQGMDIALPTDCVSITTIASVLVS